MHSCVIRTLICEFNKESHVCVSEPKKTKNKLCTLLNIYSFMLILNIIMMYIAGMYTAMVKAVYINAKHRSMVHMNSNEHVYVPFLSI